MANRNGETVLYSKVNLETEKSTAKVSSDGLTEVVTKANSIIIRSVAKACILGRITGPTKEVGSITRWTDSAFSRGLTGRCTEVNTRMTTSTVMASSYGQMENVMRECGGKESNTDEESVSFPITHRLMAFGNMERKLDYPMIKHTLSEKY